MSFSIVARCAVSGQLGVAVASSSPAVGARCAFVRARVGAVVTQNITDPRLGPAALDLLAGGHRPTEILRAFERTEEFLDYRQLALIDADGGTACLEGARVLDRHAALAGPDCVAAGSRLADEAIPQHMVDAFAAEPGDLAPRLLVAMRAAQALGGEAGPIHSAAILIAEREAWPLVDLRVDWTAGDPIAALGDLWRLWEPQMRDYVARAINPSSAPGFKAAGDP